MKSTIYIPKRSSVLVVEDSEERIDWFRKKIVAVNHLTFAETPNAGLLDVRLNRYDIIFLDHDAVMELIDASNPDYLDLTFYKVAEELARQHYSGMVIIHSHNPVGARRMARLLERHARVVILPFGTFDIEVQ